MAQADAQDIRVRLGIEVDEFLQRLGSAMKQMGSMVTKAQAQLNSMMQQANARISEQQQPLIGDRLQRESQQLKNLAKGVIPSVRRSADTVRRAFSGIGNQVMRNQKTQQAYWDNYFKGSEGARKAIQNTTGEFEQSQSKFQGWALSVMFFGMALSRAFNTIWRSSTKTFQDIMHSVDGTVTGFDKMNSSLAYLQFVAGAALEPVAEMLIPVIDRTADWVSENEKLFAGIVSALGVGGTVLTAIGMGVLAWDGMVDGIKNVRNAFSNLLNADWAGLRKNISKAAGTVAIYYALEEAQDAFSSFKKGNWVKGLLSAASAGLKAAGGYRLLKGKKYGGALFAFGIALDMVEEGTLFRSLSTVLAPVGAFITTVAQSWGAKFEEGIFNGILNGIIDAVAQISGGIIGDWLGINEAMENRLRDALNTKDTSFDFKRRFNENLKTAQEGAKLTDDMFNRFLESGFQVDGPDSVAAGRQVTENNITQNIYMQPDNSEELLRRLMQEQRRVS